jgi:hypothetical protein
MDAGSTTDGSTTGDGSGPKGDAAKGDATGSGDSSAGADGSSDGGANADGSGQPFGAMCLTPNWCWENPLPQGYPLHSVRGTSPGDVWAVGDFGTTLHWDGNAWTRVDAPTNEHLYGVWSASPTDAWAVGLQGTVLHWNGSAWTATTGVTTKDGAGVWGSASNDVWAIFNLTTNPASPVPDLLHYDGTKWSVATPSGGTGSAYLTGLWGTAANDVWAAGDGFTMIHFDGSKWNTVQDPGFNNFEPGVMGFWGQPSGGTTWLMAGGPNYQSLSHTTGSGWTQDYVSSPDVFSLSSIWGSAPNDLWLGGPSKILHWDGANMAIGDNPVPEDTLALEAPGVQIWGASAADVWMVGGAMAHGNAGAWTQWWQGAVGTAIGGSVLVGSDANDVWDFGPYASLHYDGTSWSSVTSLPTNDLFVAAYVGSSTAAWALGGEGDVEYWNGTAWKSLGTVVMRDKGGGIWASAPDDVWVENGSDGDTRWDGSTWQLSPFPSGSSCYSVPAATALWGSSSTDVWLVGTGGAVHRVGPSTNPTCVLVDAMVQATTIWGRTASDIWAVGANGVAFHYDGSSWTARPTGTGIALKSVWASSPTDAWAAGDDPIVTKTSGLLHWDGTTWTATGIQGMGAVWGADASNLWTAGSGGFVLRHKP